MMLNAHNCTQILYDPVVCVNNQEKASLVSAMI